MSLEKLLKEINDAQKFLGIDIRDPKYAKTTLGLATAQEAAKRSLPQLLTDYQNTLLANGVGIFVLGSTIKVQEFVTTSLNMTEGVSLAIDADSLYRPIADSVFKTVGNKGTFTLDQVLMVQKYVFDVVQSRKLPIRQGVILTNDKHVNHAISNYDDAFKQVRNLIRASFGDVLNVEFMKDELTKQAILQQFTGSNVPVLISNIKQDEVVNVGSLFLKGKGQIDIEVNDEINPEYVTKQLKNVVKQIKTKKQ